MSDQRPQQPRPQPSWWEKAFYSPGWSEEVPAQQAPAISGSGAVVPTATPEQEYVVGEGAAIVLRVLAWLDLVGGMVAGFYFVLSAREQPVLGIILIVQGIFLCAFLLGIASVIENVAAIRRRLGA